MTNTNQPISEKLQALLNEEAEAKAAVKAARNTPDELEAVERHITAYKAIRAHHGIELAAEIEGYEGAYISEDGKHEIITLMVEHPWNTVPGVVSELLALMDSCDIYTIQAQQTHRIPLHHSITMTSWEDKYTYNENVTQFEIGFLGQVLGRQGMTFEEVYAIVQDCVDMAYEHRIAHICPDIDENGNHVINLVLDISYMVDDEIDFIDVCTEDLYKATTAKVKAYNAYKADPTTKNIKKLDDAKSVYKMALHRYEEAVKATA